MASSFIKNKAKKREQIFAESNTEAQNKKSANQSQTNFVSQGKASDFIRNKATERSNIVPLVANTNNQDKGQTKSVPVSDEENAYKQNTFIVPNSRKGSSTSEVTAKYSKDKYGAGNIDLTDRPIYINDDGKISTVDSRSYGIDGKEVLLPTIAYDENGKAVRLTDEQAVQRYYNTGEYLGKFDTQEEADAYAHQLHLDQDAYYNAKMAANSAKATGKDLLKFNQNTFKVPESRKSNNSLSVQKPNAENKSYTSGGRDIDEADGKISTSESAFTRAGYSPEAQAVFKRYDINPDTFTWDDLRKWAAKNNLVEDRNGSQLLGFIDLDHPNPFTSSQKVKDADILTALANNNQRKERATKDEGAGMAVVFGLGDSMLFGAVKKIHESSAKREYKAAGLDETEYVSPGKSWAKTQEEHQIATDVGETVPSLVELMYVSKLVAGATKGIKGFTSLAKWVQSAINSGLTFSTTNGIRTGIKTGNAEQTLVSSLLGLLGGAAGGAASSGTNIGLSKLLQNTNIKNLIVVNAIKNGIVSAVFAAGNVGSTYFLYPEKYRPKPNEIKRDLLSAFAFAAITSTIRDIKTSKTNKAYLDDMCKQMSDQYERLVKSSISNAEVDDTGKVISATGDFKSMAEDIIAYSENIKEFISSRELVGQSQYVKEILTNIETIETNAQSFLENLPKGETTNTASAKSTANATIPTDKNLPYASVSTTIPESETVSVGDVYKDTKTGNTITVVGRDAENTVVNIDTGEKSENRTYKNENADTLATNPQFEEIETAPKTTETPTETETPKTETVQPKSTEPKVENTPDVVSDETAPVKTFAPEDASKAVKTIESKLVFQGASDEMREKIVNKAIDIEKRLEGSDHTVTDIFNGIAKDISQNGGAKNAGEYWNLFYDRLNKMYPEKTVETATAEKAVSETNNTDEEIEAKREQIREKAKQTGEINLDEFGTLMGIPVTHMSDKSESPTVNKTTQAQEVENKETPKVIRAKKADWAAHDVQWYSLKPGSKTIVAYSTRAASDLIEALSEDNPQMTISELRDTINYDDEAKKVLQAYIDSGFGGEIAYNHFVHDKGMSNVVQPTETETKAETPKLTDKCTLTPTKRTDNGKDIWVISLNEKISKDEFDTLREDVKAVGGYYSRFAKTPEGKAIPGFIFNEQPTEDAIKVFNDFFGADENAPEIKKESLNNQPESDIIESSKVPSNDVQPKAENPDLHVGDIIEHNGKKWVVKSTDFFMEFENVDKNDDEQMFGYVGGMDSFKKTHDYELVKSASEQAETDNKSENNEKATKKSKESGTIKIADFVADKLSKGEKISALELSKVATEAFGGTMSDNAFSIKDAYDAMELGVNKHILSMDNVSVDNMLELLELLPTQTKRTEEMVKFQQFSTPPSIAYLANYAANINPKDTMLEPSAGIGGIAVFAKRDGATVFVNELDERRLNIIKELPFDKFFNEDAEQINNILGGEIEPTVIVMNPPFSSSSARNMQNTKIGAKHIEQALKILAPNGRLVAIVGQGMEDGAPAFRSWWKDIKSKYNVRANIRINGKNYNKYGTNFDIQMLVIDKNGATTHTETGAVDTLQELKDKLGGIRDERPVIDYSGIKQNTPATTRKETVGERKTGDIGSRAISDTSDDANQRQSENDKISEGKSERKGVQATDADNRADTADETGNTNVLADERERVGTGQQRGSIGNQNAERLGDSDSGQSDIQTRRDEPRKRVKRKELTDSIFEQYQTQPLKVKNAQPHPAKVSESAAMSAIEPPPIKYKPSIPQSIIDNGVVSDVQLEAISYAGQSHSQKLPNGTTRGFFLGDGTGIGKGRTIAGMMLDNYNQGRKKSLWVTLNSSLVNDAKRDVKALFGDSDLVTQFVGGNKADSVLNKNEAIMVVSYSALSKGFDNKDSNFEKIVKWLGKDFDGLIVFDEAHKMGNATATKGIRGTKKASQTGLAGIALQEALPKARIVYSSATGATEVENLRYAERLGLWGEGTAFLTGDDFVSKIKAGGIAAMELIARDMKAMGVYLSRNISYEDVRYDKITHKLTAPQRAIYDELARSWQIVLKNINEALNTTNQDKDGTAKGRVLGAFWSSQQRFFNQILTAMQVPSVIADIEKQLADGKSCVIQLVSTNEAAQNKEFERLKADDLEIDEFDLTPKQMLMTFIENGFPIIQFEEYEDEEGNKRSRPVYDSQGRPVINREALAQRDELLAKLGSIKVPSSPIDMIVNHFGSDMVAENTGRARRVIQKDGKFIEEKIANKKDADVDAFQNGDKRIIIFSKAGGTGKSYHADRSAKNQQQRVHYLLEAGWQADNAVQGFGRSHRSNQVSAPIFKLVTTDLKGQMRFISTIAKRLDQLGAMTKGQRQAGSQGMFSASDNLENSFAADVLANYYKDLATNSVDGVDDGIAIIEKLGIKDKILDEYNRIMPNAPELREVNKFLNRILSLESSEQNAVFEGYSERLQEETEKAMNAGTLDKGLENYKADRITLNEVKDIKEDERTGAKTKYYNLTAEHKIKPTKFEDIPVKHSAFVGFYKNNSNDNIRAVVKTSSTTDKYGSVTDNYKLIGVAKKDYIPQYRLMQNWTKVDTAEAEKLWNKEIADLPEFRKENLHLISGVVLPVWDKLPTENVRIYRVLTSDGDMLIGRVIPENMIDETLRRLGASRTKEAIKTSDLVDRIKNGSTVYLENGWKIVQRKVSGENRIEIVGPSYTHYDYLTKKGVFTERIQFNTRYFIPSDTGTEKIVDEVLKLSPVERVEEPKYSISESGDNNGRNDLLSGNGRRGRNESAGKQAGRISSYKQEVKGKTRAERQSAAEEILDKGFTEEKIDGVHKYNLVKPEGYNDDMKAVVAKAKESGKEVGFFIGAAQRKFDGKREFLIDAINSGDNKILLRYDGEFSPQTLLRHEDVHTEYDTSEMQAAKDEILSRLTDAEKQEILSRKRYRDYMTLYKGDKDAVWEEFVADVFAGMNDYADDFVDVVADYAKGGKTVDSYNAAEYNKIMDAGGNDAVLDNIGFGDEYSLNESGDFDELGQNVRSGELGRLDNSSETEGFDEVGRLGQTQREKPNTPHTKSIRRSGVSAEGKTSSGLTAEQVSIKEQNKLDGYATEFYKEAKLNGKEKSKMFRTKNTIYYPDASFERDDIVIKDGVASFTEKRFEDLIEEFSVPVGGQLNGDYAKGYVAYISPDDFLSLTTTNEQRIVEDARDKYGNLDTETLRNSRQTPFLEIDFDDGEVTGHEGRHRMVMLRDAGVKKVAIVVKSINPEENKYRTKKITDLAVKGQKFNNDVAPGKATISEIIPLSPNYRYEVREKFVDTVTDVKYSFTTAEEDAESLTPERREEIHKQFEKDRAGIEKPTQKQVWGERAAWVAHNMTRVFPNIPERGERGTFFAEFRKDMIQWKNLPTTASFMVQDKLNKMTEGLSPDEFKTFSELVYFLDLQEEAQMQKDRGYEDILLPNEITPGEVNAIVDELNAEASDKVKQALIKRQNIWDELKDRYIALNQYIGFDTEDKFKRKNYYHHQVIEYMNGKGSGTGGEIGIKAGRGWLKERHGSTKAINTDFLAVEYKAMLQMQYDVYIAETLGNIKKQYDIKPQLEKEALNSNKKAINAIIAKEATDEDGNLMVDGNGKPDSKTYKEQQWYNSRIMFGFSGLFDLAERGELPTFGGEYQSVVNALRNRNLNTPALYKYVGLLANTELAESATDEQEQAVISARTVLKYTAQKKAWVKETLGSDYQTWETLAKAMSDKYTIHQPRRGNYFYTKTIIDEDAFNQAETEMILALANGEINFGDIDIKKLFAQYADTVRLMGVAYEQWVLPKEIADTMQEIANPKQVGAGVKFVRQIVSAWKGWATSVNPLRTVKFGIRNLFGDLDAVIAGNPKITLYSKRAVQEIYQAMKHKNYSPEFMEWVERGGYTSMIFANEMDTEMQDKLFAHLKDKEGKSIFNIPAKLWEGYYNGVENAHNFREAILRYSAYLYFKDAIKHNSGNVKDYVASNRYIVKGLNTEQDKAYQLSKDLLGAYDEVTVLGQFLRRYIVPFYSFTETNLKRYYRMFENTVTGDASIPKKAGKLLLKVLMVNTLTLLMLAWNRLLKKDDDDKLPPSVREIPHITLGRIGDDIYAFRQFGSFSELLEWFGLDDYKLTADDWNAPLDKAYGMINPAFKLPVELATGLNFYPSLSQPRAIHDKWQHFFNSFGVDDIYNEVTGKPTRGIGDTLKGAVTYSYDYKESAYYEIIDIKKRFQGKDGGGLHKPSKKDKAKSDALYYMKTAIRYKDEKAALKYLDAYFDNGGTVKGIKQSIATLNPMYGFTGKDTIEKGKAFVASLSDDEKEKLKIAQRFYEEDLMLPENVLSMLKNDTTEEEAKNLLRNYIKAKCK